MVYIVNHVVYVCIILYLNKMPFILLSGIPSSGKTTVVNSLKDYFEKNGRSVNIISERFILEQKQLSVNEAYASSKIEKEIRGILRSEYLRYVSPDHILIVDGLNYIKGFRYELYCASKTSLTTNCTIHCDPGVDAAWKYNENREEQDRYSKDIFDGLVQRYEPPDSRNRWDSPLFIIVDTRKIPFSEVHSALFDKKPPPPNQSTQCPPLADTNFLHAVDRCLQLIIDEIKAALKLGREGEINITGSSQPYILNNGVNLPNLLRQKRQFLVYVKSHADMDLKDIPIFFVQYLNTGTSF